MTLAGVNQRGPVGMTASNRNMYTRSARYFNSDSSEVNQ